jgi:hypothetical protein
MSAFVVNKEHIDALVILAFRGPRDAPTRWTNFYWYEGYFEGDRPRRMDVTPETCDAVGSMLLRECIASVAHRYRDTLWPELPGPVPNPDPFSYTCQVWDDRPRPTAVEGLKLIDCYEYQSCEHPGWHSSSARCFCEALRLRLIAALPGYDEAPYEWPPREATDAQP